MAIRHQLVIWKKLNSHVAPYVKSSVMCDWGSLHHAKCTMYRVFVPISLSPTTHSHRFCCERLFLKLHTQLIYIYIHSYIIYLHISTFVGSFGMFDIAVCVHCFCRPEKRPSPSFFLRSARFSTHGKRP